MAELAFFAADTMEMNLYEGPTGLTGHEIKQLPFGPWQLELDVQAQSDIVVHNCLSFWVILGRLQTYWVIKEKTCFILILDAEKLAGLTLTIEAPGIYERIKQLKPAILANYQWENNRWTTATIQ